MLCWLVVAFVAAFSLLVRALLLFARVALRRDAAAACPSVQSVLRPSHADSLATTDSPRGLAGYSFVAVCRRAFELTGVALVPGRAYGGGLPLSIEANHQYRRA